MAQKIKKGDKVEVIRRLIPNRSSHGSRVYHWFPIGTQGTVIGTFNGIVTVEANTGKRLMTQALEEEDVKLIKSLKAQPQPKVAKTNMKNAQTQKLTPLQAAMGELQNEAKRVALEMCKPNNTITTLEVKQELRKQYPWVRWNQNDLHNWFEDFVNDGTFKIVADNGTYRTYADPKQKARKSAPVKANVTKVTKVAVTTPRGKTITRKQALSLMQNNRGHFFTATFIKKDKTERTLNGQYLKDQDDPATTGYVKVKESGKLKVGENPIRNINLDTLKQLRIQGKDFKIRK
jgi:hypothetical protein